MKLLRLSFLRIASHIQRNRLTFCLFFVGAMLSSFVFLYFYGNAMKGQISERENSVSYRMFECALTKMCPCGKRSSTYWMTMGSKRSLPAARLRCRKTWRTSSLRGCPKKSRRRCMTGERHSRTCFPRTSRARSVSWRIKSMETIERVWKQWDRLSGF